MREEKAARPSYGYCCAALTAPDHFHSERPTRQEQATSYHHQERGASGGWHLLSASPSLLAAVGLLIATPAGLLIATTLAVVSKSTADLTAAAASNSAADSLTSLLFSVSSRNSSARLPHSSRGQN